MTFCAIAGLMRRHLLAVTAVLIIAVCVGYDIRNSPPMYSESATVEYALASSMAKSDVKGQFAIPLIATEVMMSQALMSQPAQGQVRAAGGTAQFEFVPANLYSLQYPNYDEPGAAFTTTSQRPADVRRTFLVVLRLLGQRLAAMQAQAGVPARNRIRTFLVGDTGPIARPGSSTRVSAGLTVLTVVAVFMVANFLDRRQRGPGVIRPALARRRLVGRARALSDP